MCLRKIYYLINTNFKALLHFLSAEESFGSIIQAKFTNFANSDADYPTITSIKKTGEMPNPRTTRAAQSILKAREDAIAQVREIGVNRNHTLIIIQTIMYLCM